MECDVKVLIIVLVTKHQTNVLVKIIRSFLCLSRLTTWQQNVELTDNTYFNLGNIKMIVYSHAQNSKEKKTRGCDVNVLFFSFHQIHLFFLYH